jgi:DNA-binding transcriptional LysR family regulator
LIPSLEIRQLRAFTALVDRGSFTGAAEALGVSQSTVSEALASLERALGTAVVLRRRGSRGITVTDAGHALLPHARGMLAAVEAALVAVAEAEAGAQAAVDIIANESISTYLLPRVLPALRERWPRVRYAVTVAACAGVRAGIARGEFDLGLLLGTDAHPALPGVEALDGGTHGPGDVEHVTVGGGIPLAVFAAPGHPLAPGADARAARESLVAYPFFLSDAAGDFHDLVRRYFHADGLPGPALEPAGSVEAVKRGVLSTPAALGVLPGYALRDELRAGHAVRIALEPPPPHMRVEAILPVRPARHPAVRMLLESLQAELCVTD